MHIRIMYVHAPTLKIAPIHPFIHTHAHTHTFTHLSAQRATEH